MANPQIDIRSKGHAGDDKRVILDTPEQSYLFINENGETEAGRRFECRTSFAPPPAATTVVAGKDPFYISVGTGTEVVTVAATGGINVKTQASTPTSGDNAIISPVADAGGVVPITAKSLIRFEAMARLTAITAEIFSIGLNENVTDADPTGTVGEGAMFLFDPGEAVTTGLTTAQHANWILAHKVNGADTFTATDIQVEAGRDYYFRIEIDADLKANFYINNYKVADRLGQGPALTSGDTVKAMAAIETTASAQKDFDLRYLVVSRRIG